MPDIINFAALKVGDMKQNTNFAILQSILTTHSFLSSNQ